MKNAINYYYNLTPCDIRQSKNGYHFEHESYSYVLEECFRTTEELYELYNLEYYLYDQKVYLHQFILNKSNEIVTEINNKRYVLLRKLITNDKKITFEDLRRFSNIKILPNYKNITKNNWRDLWIQKVDYIEYQIDANKNRYKILSHNVDYFIGIIETAISLLLNKYSVELYLSHRRVKSDTKVTDLYDPLNIIVDTRVRDISEYYKNYFFKYNVSENEILNFLNDTSYSYDEKILFFIRFLFPSDFLDLYDEILLNGSNEKLLNNIINKTNDYEELIKNMYLILYRKRLLPDIEWLKKM